MRSNAWAVLSRFAAIRFPRVDVSKGLEKTDPALSSLDSRKKF